MFEEDFGYDEDACGILELNEDGLLRLRVNEIASRGQLTDEVLWFGEESDGDDYPYTVYCSPPHGQNYWLTDGDKYLLMADKTGTISEVDYKKLKAFVNGLQSARQKLIKRARRLVVEREADVYYEPSTHPK